MKDELTLKELQEISKKLNDYLGLEIDNVIAVMTEQDHKDFHKNYSEYVGKL